MTGRRTNLALLALLAAALVSGVVSFGIGTGWVRWATLFHGITGFAIVVLVPWKSVVARRGLRRPRSGRVASIVLAVLVTVTVASGVLFSTGLVLRYGPLTANQVHVGSAVLSVPLAVRHVWVRPVRLQRIDLNRRNLVRSGALLAAGGVVWGVMEGSMRLLSLPGRNRSAAGSHERGSFRPAAMPTTQWFDDSEQRIDPDGWRLVVRANGAATEWSYAELADIEDGLTATLDCTGGWFATQEWSGVALERLVGDADGSSLLVKSVTGYHRRFPLRDASRLLLATRVGGAPLSTGHGFPARLVAPGRRGFWWVKWVVEISVEDRPWWFQSPFPLT